MLDNQQIIKNQIESIPNELIDIRKLIDEQQDKTQLASQLNIKIKKQIHDIAKKDSAIKELKTALSNIDYSKLIQEQNKANNLNGVIDNIQQKLITINNKIKMLDDHEYDPECKYCCENPFVKDANIAAATKQKYQSELSQATLSLSNLDLENISQQIEHHNVMKDSLQIHEKNITNLKLLCEKNKTLEAKTRYTLKTITEKINEYEDNKDAIENLEKLISKQNLINKNIKSKEKQINQCEEKVLEAIKLVGTYEQKILNLREQKQEYQDLQREFAAYDLYMQCMHPNGIAYDIIKKKIPVIN